MPEHVITNAKIVLADEIVSGTICVDDGTIKDISSSPSSNRGALDFAGDFLIPGLVELHTDNLERHIMPRPKSYWPVDAAVLNHDRELCAAGITTVFDAVAVGYAETGTRKSELITAMADSISRLAGEQALRADHFIHWRCEIACEDIMSHIGPVIDNPRTAMVSVMDHTPGQRQFASLDAYYAYYKSKYGYSDAEMEGFIVRRRREHELYSAANRKTVVRLAHDRGLAIASHDDATEAHVEEAIEDGIVVAEFPTTIEAARASHNAGLAVLMGAPNVVRGQSHSGNVSARELAGLRLLDILSSDYVPFSLLYGATLLARTCEGISLPQSIAKVTRNPARQVGLDDRGEIAISKRADLVRFRMNADLPAIVEVWRGGERIA